MKKINKRKILNTIFKPINALYFKVFTLLNNKTILNRNNISSNLPGERILILAPHVDDETIGCGGAILKYKNNSKRLSICYLTKSQKRGSGKSPKDIAKERQEEAYKVAAKVGLVKDDLFFLSGEDGNLLHTDIKDELLEVIEKIRPEIIFVPIFLDTHKDHYAANIKLLDAYKSKPDLFKGVEVFLYESQSPITPIYSNVILDIRDVFKEKLELLKMFKSQNINIESIKNVNHINGLAPKLEAAEAFIRISIEEYKKIIDSSIYSAEEEFISLRENLNANRDNIALISSYRSSIKYKNYLNKFHNKKDLGVIRWQ